MNILHGHVTEETAYEVDGYPYGGYRTKCRWWIETATKGKGKGQQRIVQQTLNPKTGVWNKPHASTYNDFVVLYTDEIGHVHSYGVNCTSPNYLVKFATTPLYNQLSEEERKRFQVCCITCWRLNPSSWDRYKAIVQLVRATDKPAKYVYDMLVAARPDDHYIYESDIEEVMNMVKVEKAGGYETNLYLFPAKKA